MAAEGDRTMRSTNATASSPKRRDVPLPEPVQEPSPIEPESRSAEFSSFDQELNVNIHPLPNPTSPRRRLPSAPGAYFTDATSNVSTPAQKVPFALIGADLSASNPPGLLQHPAADDSSNLEDATDSTSQCPRINDRSLMVANPIVDPELLPKAEEYDPETASNNSGQSSNRQVKEKQLWIRAGCFGFLAVLLIITVVTTIAVALAAKRAKEDFSVSPASTNLSSTSSNVSNSTSPSMEATILALLPNHTQWQLRHDPSSPQAVAFQWLLEDPQLESYTTPRVQQRFALATLYHATNGATWHNNSRWLSYQHHECAWFHKPTFAMKDVFTHLFDGYLDEFEHPSQFCSEEGLYENLWLDQNSLRGSLPLELYLLTNLQTLSIGLDNDLRGTVSSHIGLLTNLEFVAMYRLETPSTIPSEIGVLTKLRGVGFNDNQIRGSLPTEIHQLTGLQTLILSRNRELTGTLPSNIYQFSNLRWLSIDECNLDGTLPSEMGKLKYLEWMVFGGNRFSGSLPSELGLMKSLKILSVWGNQLSGSFPSELGELSQAHLFSLRNNAFSGTIATEFGRLSHMAVLNFQDNYGLSGPIPSQLSLLTKLEELSFQNNLMKGSIPTELGRLSNMQRFSISNNNMSGTVPHQLEAILGNLYALGLEGNAQLSGIIPEALCHINQTCVESPINTCEKNTGLTFDCSTQLCGCNCSCAGSYR